MTAILFSMTVASLALQIDLDIMDFKKASSRIKKEPQNRDGARR